MSLILKDEWDSLCEIVNANKGKLSHVDVEYSDAAAWNVTYDIPRMISECRIIDSLPEDVISFVSEVKDNAFIDFVYETIERLDEIPEPPEPKPRVAFGIIEKHDIDMSDDLIVEPDIDREDMSNKPSSPDVEEIVKKSSYC